MNQSAMQEPVTQQTSASRDPQKENDMARAAEKLTREIRRLEEIDDRFREQADEALRERAALGPEMVAAMTADSPSQVDEIERRAQDVDARLTSIARRRDSVRQAIGLMEEELAAVRAGDAIRAARRRFDAGEQRFDSAQKDAGEGLSAVSAALGEMLAAYSEAKAAADALVDLGEERPGLYAFDPRSNFMLMDRLKDEAVQAALIAAGSHYPAFDWTPRIGAAMRRDDN